MTQHQSTSLAPKANNYLTEAIEHQVVLPGHNTEEDESMLRSIVYNVRNNMQVLETSAAKICHDIYRAKLLYGPEKHELFTQFALGNFFRNPDGTVKDTDGTRRKIRAWVANGKLVQEYFEKNGHSDFDRFKAITMAALTSLSSAPDAIAEQYLSHDGDISATDVNMVKEASKRTGSVVLSDLSLMSRELKKSAEADENELLKTANEGLEARVLALQESKILSDRQTRDAAAEVKKMRQQLDEAVTLHDKAKAMRTATEIGMSHKGVQVAERDERAAKHKLDQLIAQQSQVQQRLDAVTQQLAAGNSLTSVINQLRDDTAVLISKYPSALRVKLEDADKRVSPILAEIAHNLRVLADQLSPGK